MSREIRIEFRSSERGEWIRTIHERTSGIMGAQMGDAVILVLEGMKVEDLQPMHIVTMACMIEKLDRLGYSIFTKIEDASVSEFLMKTLQFPKYWGEKKNYVPASHGADAILNLWRFEETEKESYAWRVHDYLQRRFFKGKDLSAAKNSLLEVCYNVSDHADADGNAFSFIKFNEDTGKLQVAVCDFGKGIARTVREKFPDIESNTEALVKAMESGFTVGSRGHNRGFGLDSIRAACTGNDFMRLFSNGALLRANAESVMAYDASNIPLNGTLVYYELTLSHFEDLEIIESFEF